MYVVRISLSKFDRASVRSEQLLDFVCLRSGQMVCHAYIVCASVLLRVRTCCGVYV